MRTPFSKLLSGLVGVFLLTLLTASVYGQGLRPDLQYYRHNDFRGLNTFETPKEAGADFDGFAVRVGGSFNVQFQALTQSNNSPTDTLVELSNNFSLPTANLDLDVQIADGVRMHLRTYLSSRNHSETWVKGGYFQMDKLDFISEGFLSGIMEYTTLRFGMDEINYGDAHFRRTDNARAIYNPFVGNYILDAFATEPFAEVTVQYGSGLAVLGLSNGRLNQEPIAGDDGLAMYGKLGFDHTTATDIRLRLTGSFYHSTSKSTRDYLYNGDRAGAHYYFLLETLDQVGELNFEPRFNPGFPNLTSFQINPFVKAGGLEFFGILEFVNNGVDEVGGAYTQVAGDLLYRFGGQQQFYIGGRYNRISGERTDDSPETTIDRFNIGGGWFMTNNVLAKIEYVTSTYDGDGFNGTRLQGAEWSGVVAQASISF